MREPFFVSSVSMFIFMCLHNANERTYRRCPVTGKVAVEKPKSRHLTTTFDNKFTIMAKKISPANNAANTQNSNKGTNGTNKQFDQNQGNRGKQLNPNQK